MKVSNDERVVDSTKPPATQNMLKKHLIAQFNKILQIVLQKQHYHNGH